MYVFCVGMYRACSTWQYEIVSHLVERHYTGRRLGFLTGDQFREHDAVPPSNPEWQVLKSHDTHPEFTRCLVEARALAVYAYRDLRDVAYSLMHKFRASFDDIIKNRLLEGCLANDASWTSQPNVCCQRYEAIVADPVRAITELAGHLRLSLAASEAEDLAKEYSFEANQQRTNALRNRLTAEGVDLSKRDNTLVSDPHTLLHWNHLRGGRDGSWREQASLQQRQELAKLCGDWLIARGYERDGIWAEPVEALQSFQPQGVRGLTTSATEQVRS